MMRFQSVKGGCDCTAGRGFGFLDEHMQHQQAAVLNGGVHGAGYTVAVMQAHFPQLAFYRADIRQAHALRPEGFQQVGNVREPRPHLL
jgi:hypothetical protein